MRARRFAIAAIAAGLLAATTAIGAADPFSAFAGNWAGSGTIEVNNAKERIRCRSTNTESGNSLKLTLRCASDSYRFELQSDISYEGGNISGSWSETSRGVTGSLSGRMSGGRIQATAQSVSFNASLSIVSSGGRQNVSIRSPGSEISEVAISLARAGR
jgi:hypothetical protein